MDKNTNEKIGIFGGTFDPIHLGHLNLALEICEKCNLDEIWFCPAKTNPFKDASPPLVSETHRTKMIERAIEDIPSFKLYLEELERLGPSYTIDTISHLQQAYPSKQFSLILGEDAILNFSEWKNAEQIVSKIPLLIGSRARFLQSISEKEAICRAIERGMTVTREMEISSTEIRLRLKKGLYCGHLIPKKVMDYIFQHRLYSCKT